MVYKGSNKTYVFRTFETIISNEIRNNINMSMENDERNHFLKHIRDSKSKTNHKPLSQKK